MSEPLDRLGALSEVEGLRASVMVPAPNRNARAGFGVRRALRRITVVIAMTMGAAAFAADDEKIFTPGGSSAATPSTSAGTSLNSISLLLGVALAGVGGWMVWRNRRGNPAGREVRALAIDETRSLGSRQYLVVASYEGKKFLIGVCPGRIDLLSPLEGTSSPEKGRG